jgi:hypothetical protein
MSKRAMANLSAALILGGVLLFSACNHAAVGVTYVSTPPPPPIAEPIIVSPGPGFVWVRGYHTWEGNRYIWAPGHWERIPGGRHHWVPGHWRNNRHGWYWVPGHWR